MAMQETIALLGIKERNDLLDRLVQENYRLLFVGNEESELRSLSEEYKDKQGRATVEFVSCAKSGCWEADIIAFLELQNIQNQLARKIKEVCTQKIVVCLSYEQQGINFSAVQVAQVQELLPHSKVVHILIDSEKMEAFISGKEPQGIDHITGIFEKTGYKTTATLTNE